jgi:hypothetical protein
LAKRDAKDEHNVKFFQLFGLTVDHICYKRDEIDHLREAYKQSDIVYGSMHDYLHDAVLDEFHDRVKINENK